eukprot:3842710-Ditylum_brightwellii.AAC.1
MTVYRPCKPSSKGTSTVYSQQLSYFHFIGRLQCPRNAIMKGIKGKAEEWLKKGDQIIVMGDFNKYIHKNSMVQFFAKLRMRELIMERHGKGPATTISNQSGEAVDGIQGTAGIKLTGGGYLPFYYDTQNHQWEDPKPEFVMKDKRTRSRYNYINKQFLKRHCAVERMRERTTNMTFPAPQDKIKEYKKLDKLRMEGRKLALRKCRKVYVSKVDSHPDIK